VSSENIFSSFVRFLSTNNVLTLLGAAAMMSFIDDINRSIGYGWYDKIIPSVVVAIMSCARDISFLSKFSAVGLLALALSFG
jgi:hypothetical protein